MATTIKQTVDSAEQELDATVASLPLPTKDSTTAAWLLLTATEDALRLPLIATKDQLHPASYIGLTDRFKYGLKHALNITSNRQYFGSFRRIPRTVDPDHYKQAITLLLKGAAYQAAVAAFSGYHQGMNECHVIDKELAFRPIANRDLRLRARDLLEATAGSGRTFGIRSPLLMMAEWLRTVPPTSIASHIRSSIRLDHHRIVYTDTLDADRDVYTMLATGSEILPDDWFTSYGDKRTITSILRALLTIQALHSLTINHGARIKNIVGGSLPSIVLSIDRSRLISRIMNLTDIDRSTVTEIVRLLTYGQGVNSPDPALQPLISPGGEMLLCAPMLVCSSNLERNFLTLLARVAPREFHASSHVFEHWMTTRLLDALKARPWMQVVNKTIPVIRSVGEIDCLLLDPMSNTVVLLELWWQMPPAETRELNNREETALAKTKQARRKLDAVEKNLPDILKYLDLTSDGTWKCHAALVSESFLPSQKNTDNVFVISRRALQGLLVGPQQTLSGIWDAIERELWLPEEGRHFTTEIIHHQIGDVKFNTLELIPTELGALFALITMDVGVNYSIAVGPESPWPNQHHG